MSSSKEDKTKAKNRYKIILLIYFLIISAIPQNKGDTKDNPNNELNQSNLTSKKKDKKQNCCIL